MTFLFALAALGLFTVSLMPYIPLPHIAVDLPSHFVFQYIVAAIAVLFLGWALKAPPVAQLFVFVSLSMCLLQVSPFITFPTGKEKGGVQVKFLQANVLRFNEDGGLLKALIEKENPDIIVLSEATGVFGTLLESMKQEYPHQNIVARDNSSFGMAVASKLPLMDMQTSYPARADIPSMMFKAKVGGEILNVVSLHPANPVKDLAARDREFEKLAAQYKTTAQNLVLLGDFNATPYCYTLRKLTRDLGLKNARDGAGVMGTYPAQWPFFMRLPIDHFLASRGIAVREHRLGADIGSDHLPLVTVISL